MVMLAPWMGAIPSSLSSVNFVIAVLKSDQKLLDEFFHTFLRQYDRLEFVFDRLGLSQFLHRRDYPGIQFFQ